MFPMTRPSLAALLLAAIALPVGAVPGAGFGPAGGVFDASRLDPSLAHPVPFLTGADNGVLPGRPTILGFAFPVNEVETAVAGDVDANGSSDWLFAEPWFRPNAVVDPVGRVQVFRRDKDGNVIGTLTLAGPGAYSLFGASVAPVGDVDGDGYDDIAVGAPNVGSGAGRVYVFKGSAGGTLSTASFTINGAAGSFFGYRVAYAGDVNGDGYDDLLASAPGYTETLTQRGAAYCYLGGPSGLSSTPVRTWFGEADFEYLGYGIAGGGDVNADGYTDVVLGSPGYTNVESAEGRARLFLGGPGGPSSTSMWQYEPDVIDERVGEVIALPGDLNADGYGEIALGVPQASAVSDHDGLVIVFAGSPFLFALQPLFLLYGGDDFSAMGYDVAPAGDQNGDGFADLLFSQPFGGVTNDEGRWYVLYGSPIIPSFNSLLVFGGQPGTYAGLSVSGGGDRGDGFSDVLAGGYTLPLNAPGAPADAGAGLTPIPALFTSSLHSFHEFGYMPTRPFAQGLGETGFGISTVMMDINGDGYDDAIVGGADYTDGIPNQGIVRAYYGDEDGFGDATMFVAREGGPMAPAGGSGIPQTWNAADWAYTGPYEWGNFAFSMANAGDVNGDGYEDLLIGSPTAEPDSAAEGVAYLFYGGPNGPDTQPDWTSEGQNAFTFHGYSVAGAGDVNQDGYADILIGSPLASPGGVEQAGRAGLYYGSALGPAHVPAFEWTGTQASAILGVAVAGVGDVNGDGFPDVAVTEPAFVDGEVDEGRVRVFQGSAAGINPIPIFTWQSDITSAQIGFTCASAGDVNGDGYADFMIGNPYWSNPELSEGSVQVFLGGASSVTLAATIESDVAGAELGRALSTAGDMNADGFSEIILGAPFLQTLNPISGRPAIASPATPGGDLRGLMSRSPNVGEADGAAFIYFGAADGVEPFVRYVFDGAALGLSGTLGRSVAGGGDLNGDGWPDVLYAAPYADGVKVVDNGVISTALGNVVSDGVGRPRRVLRSDGLTPIAHGGRGDAPNSFRVAGLGHHPMGRGKARLQWQAKAPGTLLDDTGIQSSSVLRTGVPTGELGSTATYGGAATGLATGTAYRLRERYATRHPFFPHTPWFTSARNGLLAPDLRTFGPTGAVAVDDGAGVTSALSFAGPWPNPLAGTGTLSFALPQAGRVTIDAFDASGRRVARVLDGDAAAGPSTVTWDARDDAGRALPRGLYFLRLKSMAGEKTVKAVLAR